VIEKERDAMTKGISLTEANLPMGEFPPSSLIGRKGKALPASDARTVRSHKAAGRRGAGLRFDQSLLGGLLDPKTSSHSLAALAHAAAFSGKRLILEIRDDNPVRIVRTYTAGI
jgi:hypothetical protein